MGSTFTLPASLVTHLIPSVPTHKPPSHEARILLGNGNSVHSIRVVRVQQLMPGIHHGMGHGSLPRAETGDRETSHPGSAPRGDQSFLSVSRHLHINPFLGQDQHGISFVGPGAPRSRTRLGQERREGAREEKKEKKRKKNTPRKKRKEKRKEKKEKRKEKKEKKRKEKKRKNKTFGMVGRRREGPAASGYCIGLVSAE